MKQYVIYRRALIPCLTAALFVMVGSVYAEARDVGSEARDLRALGRDAREMARENTRVCDHGEAKALVLQRRTVQGGGLDILIRRESGKTELLMVAPSEAAAYGKYQRGEWVCRISSDRQ
jgi:hypothetical protein